MIPPVESSGYISGTNRLIADRGSVTITPGNGTEFSFNANLEFPGDYYEFTVPVLNSGTIDAMIAEDGISSITTPSLIDYDFIKYSVIYADAAADENTIEVKDGLRHNELASSRIKIKVRVEYSKDVSNEQVNNMPAGGINISSTYALKYVQADWTANFKDLEYHGPHSG